MERFFPEMVIEEVKEKNDIVEVISQYVQLKSIGTSHKALCPFHNEKTPSFTVNQEKQMYKCFGCGEGGDVISFIMKMENLDFTEAVKMLAQRANIYLEEMSSSKEMKDKQRKQKKYFEINKLAGRFFYNNLVQNKNPALNYILKRGLTVRTIKSFGLGYALNSWDDLLSYLKDKGYTEQEVENAGLAIKNKQKNTYYNRFRNRIMFPIFDIRGNVIGFGGRVLDDSLPKYLNSPETLYFNKSKTLYALNIARRHSKNKHLILVEGYMDVITLHQYGFKNCVATLGTSLTKDHGLILRKYFEEIVLCFDGDDAGVKATLRAIQILQDIHQNIKIILLPKGIDPDDFIKKNGKLHFEKKLNEAMNSVDYKMLLAQQKYNSNSTRDKIDLGKEIANIIREIKSPIEREEYVKRAVERTGISRNALVGEIYAESTGVNADNNIKYSSNRRRNNRYIQMVPLVEEKGHIIAAKQLIKYMLVNPQFISNINKEICSDDFYLANHQIIFEYIINNQKNIEALDKIQNYLPEIENEIKDILHIDIQQVNIEQVVEKYKLDAKRYQLLYQRRELKKTQDRIIKEENPNKEEVEKQLLKLGMKMMEINIELQKLQSEEGRE